MRSRAALGSVVFFVLAPGTLSGVVPYLLTGWRERPAPVAIRALGLVLAIAGVLSLVECFARFVTRGRGTPAPVAAPTELVASGQYRFVRNPMYLAVLAVVLGQALFFGSARVVLYAGVLFVLFHAWVVGYEEPTLARQFGASYAMYRRNVPRWRPRRPPPRVSSRP